MREQSPTPRLKAPDEWLEKLEASKKLDKIRVAVRATGYFDIKDSTGKRIRRGIAAKYCRPLQKADGWQYERRCAALPPYG
ncbi:MAG: hypothetical protein M0Z41_01400 [Peptococcaceae bacterium]|jgi:hypothetical protein|nr:hypothetical protein [Peptococcaceae bacterium]